MQEKDQNKFFFYKYTLITPKGKKQFITNHSNQYSTAV